MFRVAPGARSSHDQKASHALTTPSFFQQPSITGRGWPQPLVLLLPSVQGGDGDHREGAGAVGVGCGGDDQAPVSRGAEGGAVSDHRTSYRAKFGLFLALLIAGFLAWVLSGPNLPEVMR